MSDVVCILFSLAWMRSDFSKENIFSDPRFADSTWTDFQALFYLTSCQQKALPLSSSACSACVYEKAYNAPAEGSSYHDGYALTDAQ